MEEPGTTAVGAARKRSSVAASQLRPASRSAWEYGKEPALAAARPNTPCRLGPWAPPLSSASALWHSAHWARKKALPALGASSSSAAKAPWVQARVTAVMSNFLVNTEPPGKTLSTMLDTYERVSTMQ